MYGVFISHSVDGSLGWFHNLAILHSTTVNVDDGLSLLYCDYCDVDSVEFVPGASHCLRFLLVSLFLKSLDDCMMTSLMCKDWDFLKTCFI